MPKNVLITCVGSLGDFHPFLGLARHLQTEGFSVHMATQPSHVPLARAAGIPASAIPTFVEEPGGAVMETLLHPIHGPQRLIQDQVIPSLVPTFETLLPLVQKADLVICSELLYAAPVAANYLDKPWLSVVLAPMSLFSSYDPPVLPAAPWASAFFKFGAQITRTLFALSKKRCRPWVKPVEDLRARLSLPVDRSSKGHPIFEGKHSPYGMLAFFPEWFGQPQPDWPTTYVQAGFPLYDNCEPEDLLPAELEAFLAAGEPPVVFTLGSAAVKSPGQFFEESAKVTKKLGIRSVLVTGQNPPPPSFDPDTMFALPYASYSTLFPRTRVIVHSGGIGTTAQAFQAGKPMLVVPFAFDQPDNAARVVKTGVGLSLNRKAYTCKTAVKALTQLLNTPDFVKSAQQGRPGLRPGQAYYTVTGFIKKLFQKTAASNF